MEIFDKNKFSEMVRENGPITVAQAKKFNKTVLGEDERKHPCCACRHATLAKEKRFCGSFLCEPCVYNLRCGICLWYGCWFAACDTESTPGIYTCSDNKGNTYHMIRVDVEKPTWACFSDNQFFDPKYDETPVCCYCR